MAAESHALRDIRAALHAAARPETITVAQKFFKTGPGDYAEGDRFIGVKVPDVRHLVRTSDSLATDGIPALLRSPIHEERLLALLIMVRRYQRQASVRAAIVEIFLQEIQFINNWDLVDTSAPHILGPWLLPRDRSLLHELAQSSNLWKRRIAILATFAFIRAHDFQSTFALAKTFLSDPHDLMHKATGWMLREIGNRDEPALRLFLDHHASSMPRTMLRYAIEKFPTSDRAVYRNRPHFRPKSHGPQVA